ncbi:tautomerase family protein [Nocardia terpenica]|uniref:tautomerase family protein n=1 Tax=Nocardia terpenica TaxID=455432 RepID=UPI0018935DBD|nr:tautomerase family protein [Nocardia terpenica]MBF6059221.1 tautomerase family protein [Nocardia terpenica]MBF6103240.1 tautomerase family protein [Nocardia terpenica]MBF6110571.1 tautomerase family protein [Nocardia terpenica]MBF6116702.1 tautomerase family protein [Nocardia terpenica]
MPLVRIDLVRGRSRDQIGTLADAIHHAIVDVLAIPERDRFQIITQHDAEDIIAQDAGLGFDRSPGLVMVQIFTQTGRTAEVKQKLFHTIAMSLGDLGIDGRDVFIGIVENAAQDWSFAYGRAQYLEGDLPIPA